MVLRRATVRDGKAIADLVASFARRGALLPRQEKDVIGTIDDWMVAFQGDTLLACGSLLVYSPTLAEIRSLAVASQAQGQGIGSAVVGALVQWAAEREIRQLFALTRAVPFFRSLGFRVKPNVTFPEKVWRDCRLCPFQEACDEVAVVFDVSSAAALTGLDRSRPNMGGSYVGN